METAARFDWISEIYDETSQPLTTAALDRIAERLSGAGIRRILEAGVGTARIALLLQQRGFRIFGSTSRGGRLKKTREK